MRENQTYAAKGFCCQWLANILKGIIKKNDCQKGK